MPPGAVSNIERALSTFHKHPRNYIEVEGELAIKDADRIGISVSASEEGNVTKPSVATGNTARVSQENVPNNLSTKVTSKSFSSSRNVNGLFTQDDMGMEHDRNQPLTALLSLQEQRVVPSRGEREEKLPRIRKTIAQRLKCSQLTNATLTVMQEIDMSALIDWRGRNRNRIQEEYGVRLGYMGAFIKAATLGAQRIPSINAGFDLENEEIIFRDYVDISVAVSTPKGLVTPVLRNCEQMDVVTIEKQILQLADKARDGTLGIDDLHGGNFSISNPGIFGSMFGTPVINYKQSAVFNMNTIYDRVVAIDGEPQIRPIMYTTLSYDHRLIEDRDAIIFLDIIKEFIEEPSKMLLA